MTLCSRFRRKTLLIGLVACAATIAAFSEGQAAGIDPASAGVPSDPPLVTAFQAPSGPNLDLMPQLPADKDLVGGGLFLSGDQKGLPVQFSVHLLMRLVYDDNINLARFNPISDWFVGIHPLLMLGIGDLKNKRNGYVRFEYMPNIFRYWDHPSANATEHLLHLQAGFTEHHLTLTFNQDIALLNAINIEQAQFGGNTARTTTNIYTSRLDASYRPTDKDNITSALAASFADSPDLISANTYSGSLYYNHQFSQTFTAGLGLYGGFTTIDEPNPDQAFEQPSVRLSWDPSPHWRLSSTASIEFRQFADGGRDQYVTPVGDVGVTFLPVEGTQLTLNASRSVGPSTALLAEDFVSTGFNMTFRQRITHNLFLGVSGGYNHARYFPTSREVIDFDPYRRENYWTVQPSVDVILAKYCSLGVYYIHREGDSSLPDSGFSNNQVGIRTYIKF